MPRQQFKSSNRDIHVRRISFLENTWHVVCNIFIRYRTLYSTSSKQPPDPTKVQKDSFGVRKEHNYLVNPGEQRNHQRGLARDLEGKLRDSGFSMIGGCNTDFPRDLLVQSLEMNQFLSKIRTKISGNPPNYKPPHKIFFWDPWMGQRNTHHPWEGVMTTDTQGLSRTLADRHSTAWQSPSGTHHHTRGAILPTTPSIARRTPIDCGNKQGFHSLLGVKFQYFSSTK